MARAMLIDPPKLCQTCGAPFNRGRLTTGRLEDRGSFLKRRFCGKKCQAEAQVKPGATHKQTMMSRARKHKKAFCENCAAKTRLHIHHVDHQIANNSPENLATLCVLCHNRLHAGLTELRRPETP